MVMTLDTARNPTAAGRQEQHSELTLQHRTGASTKGLRPPLASMAGLSPSPMGLTKGRARWLQVKDKKLDCEGMCVPS